MGNTDRKTGIFVDTTRLAEFIETLRNALDAYDDNPNGFIGESRKLAARLAEESGISENHARFRDIKAILYAGNVSNAISLCSGLLDDVRMREEDEGRGEDPDADFDVPDTW